MCFGAYIGVLYQSKYLNGKATYQYGPEFCKGLARLVVVGVFAVVFLIPGYYLNFQGVYEYAAG